MKQNNLSIITLWAYIEYYLAKKFIISSVLYIFSLLVPAMCNRTSCEELPFYIYIYIYIYIFILYILYVYNLYIIYICIYIYPIMKTMCPPGYHHSGFVATHTLGRIKTHRFHAFICITTILLLWDLSTLSVVDQLWLNK